MKTGTPDHPKALALMAALDAPRPLIVGYLELLWHFAKEYAPHGNIGKYSDDQIGKAAGYDGPGSEFVAAMVRAGWLDESREHRLLVHDWPEHADDTVHRLLARKGELFASGAKPNTARLNKEDRQKLDEILSAHGWRAVCAQGAQKGARRARTPPRHTPPDHTRPNTYVGSSTTDDVIGFVNRLSLRSLTPSTHAKYIEPRAKDDVPATTLKLAFLGACLNAFHLGFNDRHREYLDPETVFKPGRIDGHAALARGATFRLQHGEQVWAYWAEKLGMRPAAAMEHFFRIRDELLIAEGRKPIGPAAVYASGFKVGDPWPTPAEVA